MTAVFLVRTKISESTLNPVGARLAREGVVSFNIDID
jgi:hypothetical protein